MKRESLRKIIQQEISRVKEDLLVSPSDVPDSFKRDRSVSARSTPCPVHQHDPCDCPSDDEDYPLPPSVSKHAMKLTCSSCGGPLMMEGGCGCGDSAPSSYSDYEPMLMYPSAESIVGTFSLEDEEEGHKSGAYMAKSQLHKIAQYAQKLQHMIPEDHDLDDWMRSHISQAADDIGEVYHKLDYMHEQE